jgi:hypothetical protein
MAVLASANKGTIINLPVYVRHAVKLSRAGAPGFCERELQMQGVRH